MSSCYHYLFENAFTHRGTFSDFHSFRDPWPRMKQRDSSGWVRIKRHLFWRPCDRELIINDRDAILMKTCLCCWGKNPKSLNSVFRMECSILSEVLNLQENWSENHEGRRQEFSVGVLSSNFDGVSWNDNFNFILASIYIKWKHPIQHFDNFWQFSLSSMQL